MKMKTIAFVLLFALGLFGCSSGKPSAVSANAPSVDQKKTPAPNFDLENVAGGRLKSSEIKGKVAVVDFWATWCAPCIQEIPNFNKIHETYKDKGVQMLAMTTMSGALEDIKPKVAEFGMNYPVLVGDDKVEEGFGGLIGFPTTYVVDQNWNIYKKYVGMTPNKKEQIEKDIQTLLGTQASSNTAKAKSAVRETFKTAAEFDATDVAAMRKARNQWASAFAAGNPKPVEFMFSNDAVFNLPESISAKQMFDRYNAKLVFDEKSEQFVTDGGDPRKMSMLPWVSYYAAYKLTLNPKAGGNPQETSGRFMTRFHRQPDGSLKVIQGPGVREPAPDFTLNRMKGGGRVQLASLHGKPAVLIFGSYT